MTQQRTALVTGGNRGIGKAIAEGLAKLDYKVLLGARDLAKGEQAAKDISGDVVVVALDLGQRDKLKQQMKQLLDKYEIDVLVNNAGILIHGDILEVTDEEFDESLRVNFVASFDLMRLVLPSMIERGYGRIVNLSSGMGAISDGLSGATAYSVTKAALNALTLNASHAAEGDIKINSMCPGWVQTDMGGAGAPRSPEEGADTAIWLATLDADGPNGKFFRDRQQIEW